MLLPPVGQQCKVRKQFWKNCRPPTFRITRDAHRVGMVGRHNNQSVTLVDLASHEFHDLVEVNRLGECQVGAILVMGVIDPRAVDEQHVAVRILFHHLKCLPRHIHQRRLESFIIKQMILHVTLAEQTEQFIDVIDVGGVE